MQEERDQRELEQEIDHATAQEAAAVGDREYEWEQGHGHAEDVAPLALVCDAVAGRDTANDDHGAPHRNGQAAENQADDPVEVEQEDGDLQGLGLRLVHPPALFHGP